MLTFLVCLMFEAGSAGLVVPVSFLYVRWEELVWVQNGPNKKRQRRPDMKTTDTYLI